MTDEQAFLAAIAAARPGDDVPRLAFADWLEERDGTAGCPQCGYNPGKVYESAGPDSRWVTCRHCSGSGRVPNNYALRADLERLRVEVAKRRRDPERPVDDGKPFFGMYLFGWLQGRHVDTFILNRMLEDRPCDCELCLVKRAKEILVKLGAVGGVGA